MGIAIGNIWGTGELILTGVYMVNNRVLYLEITEFLFTSHMLAQRPGSNHVIVFAQLFSII